ncbi:hypothetical protein K443DRAFT_334139 [Laccaria amethystina LaAM-08-1]|uniref:Uncharacterized protein n=1 Tax=Laccaria amethystina LaAM-08-1 TaxID=1095629 RepID=A0A0C9XKS6_9AGAR|nr:hypothetical protein K443DRAFT_334139 [Laccaria amethystina LaAM-08-1]
MSNDSTYLLLSRVRVRSLAHLRSPTAFPLNQRSKKTNLSHPPASAAEMRLHLPISHPLPRVQRPSVISPSSRLMSIVGGAFPETTQTHGFFVSMYGGGRI